MILLSECLKTFLLLINQSHQKKKRQGNNKPQIQIRGKISGRRQGQGRAYLGSSSHENVPFLKLGGINHSVILYTLHIFYKNSFISQYFIKTFFKKRTKEQKAMNKKPENTQNQHPRQRREQDFRLYKQEGAWMKSGDVNSGRN